MYHLAYVPKLCKIIHERFIFGYKLTNRREKEYLLGSTLEFSFPSTERDTQSTIDSHIKCQRFDVTNIK